MSTAVIPSEHSGLRTVWSEDLRAVVSIVDCPSAPPPTWVPLNSLLCEGAQHLGHLALLCHRMEVTANAMEGAEDKCHSCT